MSVLGLLADNFNLCPLANQLAAYQANGTPLAYAGKYRAQYQFLGRLEKPLAVVLNVGDLRRWFSNIGWARRNKVFAG